MTEVVQQDGQLGSTAFLVGYLHTLQLQHIERPLHQVQRPQHVAETRMHSAGIDQISQPQLLDAPLPLEIRMLYDLQNHRVIDTQEPIIYRVVYYLAFNHLPEGSFIMLICGARLLVLRR